MPEHNRSSTPGGVDVEIEGGVAVVTIDRPDVRNAIGMSTVDELDAALDDVVESGAAVLVVGETGRSSPEGTCGSSARSGRTRTRLTWPVACGGSSTGSPPCPCPSLPR